MYPRCHEQTNSCYLSMYTQSKVDIGGMQNETIRQFGTTTGSTDSYVLSILLGRRNCKLLLRFSFYLDLSFLSQAVLFDAAVPFFLPVWALARARFKKHLMWVFIGGMAGSVFIGLGQAVIHLFQLALFNALIKYPTVRKSIPFIVRFVLLSYKGCGMFVMHWRGIPPVECSTYLSALKQFLHCL